MQEGLEQKVKLLERNLSSFSEKEVIAYQLSHVLLRLVYIVCLICDLHFCLVY